MNKIRHEKFTEILYTSIILNERERKDFGGIVYVWLKTVQRI